MALTDFYLAKLTLPDIWWPRTVRLFSIWKVHETLNCIKVHMWGNTLTSFGWHSKLRIPLNILFTNVRHSLTKEIKYLKPINGYINIYNKQTVLVCRVYLVEALKQYCSDFWRVIAGAVFVFDLTFANKILIKSKIYWLSFILSRIFKSMPGQTFKIVSIVSIVLFNVCLKHFNRNLFFSFRQHYDTIWMFLKISILIKLVKVRTSTQKELLGFCT